MAYSIRDLLNIRIKKNGSSFYIGLVTLVAVQNTL